MRHGEDDRVVGVGLGFVFERRDVVFVFGFGNIDPRVVNIDLRMVAGQFAHDVDYLGIAQVRALPALADQAKNSGESLRAGLKPGYLQVYKAWQHFLKVGQEAGVAKTVKRGGGGRHESIEHTGFSTGRPPLMDGVAHDINGVPSPALLPCGPPA